MTRTATLTLRRTAAAAALTLGALLPAFAASPIDGILPAAPIVLGEAGRADTASALHLLAAAAEAYRADPARALTAFNDGLAPFQQADLYVFAIDARSGRMLANGGFPGLTGGDVAALRDARGAAVGEAFLHLPQNAISQVSYRWRNPQTWRVETKRSQVLRVGDTLIAVGSYQSTPLAERKLHPALGQTAALPAGQASALRAHPVSWWGV
ncbi:cache domain-containing protein [Aquariibacter albus]|uniref:Cache domain-containing protein n=1 Tax=Aquariibacter albus TaxID=2759899 RepID=A0A839HFT3_9BURK|nr:cache domain-containing protein [Aquariibacter albus]MBB1160977.1 cache domain-containing protein [Aquariibacter albus]